MVSAAVNMLNRSITVQLDFVPTVIRTIFSRTAHKRSLGAAVGQSLLVRVKSPVQIVGHRYQLDTTSATSPRGGTYSTLCHTSTA
ncbi:hypothetical protein J6590_023343 [Homalodisca vitripennis]|nr:hypothetical protein J6590_023343 [Homalodisca vitripennis]